jgi:surface polysaccharide O-acyltransferase-like enzyme
MNALATTALLTQTKTPDRQTGPKNRVFYVDVVRACACVLVVVSHVFAPVCAAMNDYPPSVWWTFNLFNSLIRPCAALFVMVSGKIFLSSSREESYFQFVQARFGKLLLPFFTWSMIYVFYEAYTNETSLTFGRAVLQFLQGPTEFHLWFMYMILGLYLIMPILRRFVRTATGSDLATLISLWMGFLTLQFFFPTVIGSGLTTTLIDYGGYAVLGYALDKNTHLQKWVGVSLLLWSSILLFNAAGTYLLTIRANGILDEKLYFGAAPLVAIQGAAMFLLLKNIDERSFVYSRAWCRTLVMRLSRNSYNIYLNHVLFLWLFTQGTLGFVLSEKTGSNTYVGIALTSAAVLASSLGFSMLLQKIPWVAGLFVISPKKR